MRDRLTEVMGSDFQMQRFLPYIQFYEVEAFLFVAPDQTARLLGNSARAQELRKVVAEHESCEHIDDSPNTAPSKRIGKLFPNYRKGKTMNAHLPRICTQVGLQSLREACRLFHRWVERLESLG